MTTIYSGQTLSAIAQAKASLLVDTAEGDFLTALGNNYGVPRPPQDPSNDELYRCIIQVLAWLPKTILLTSYRLAECIFGTHAALTVAGLPLWQIYEVNPNEIILELPAVLLAGSSSNATYLHGFSSLAMTTVINATTFTCRGNILAAVSSVVGRTAYIEYSGTFNAHTINSATYDSGTDVSTVVVASAIPPILTGVRFFMDVPEANSFRGDFIGQNVSSFQTSPALPIADRVYVFGQASFDIYHFYMDLLVRASGVVLRLEVI